MLREAYRNLEKLGDRLVKINSAVNREVFHPIIIDKQKKRGVVDDAVIPVFRLNSV